MIVRSLCSVSSTFADLGVSTDLVSALSERGITEPFPIQAAAIADALAGRDLCGRAPTGSGKTLAFGVPLVARVDRGTSRRPRALVLAPTRELAQQIHDELVPLASARGRRVLTVYGGVGYGPQRNPLRKGVDIVVACPGRLEDLVAEGSIDLSDVDIVVVDEADRMADMGFLPSVRRLLDATSPDRQTMLFSATLDGDVAVLTSRYQHDPVRHEVGEIEPDVTSARHLFWRVTHEDRRRHAADVIAAAGPTLVFCRTRRGADRLARVLERDGLAAAAIHGGRSQGQRDRALAAFPAGRAATFGLIIFIAIVPMVSAWVHGIQNITARKYLYVGLGLLFGLTILSSVAFFKDNRFIELCTYVSKHNENNSHK